MGRLTRAIMDSRLLLIVFSIYLTKEVTNGLQCNAMLCTVDNGLDAVCQSLGKTENSTECGFYPCMKATGKNEKNEDFRIYYCGYDEDYSALCKHEDKCGNKAVDFVFKSADVENDETINMKEALVCCCTSGDMCNGSGLMEESLGTSREVNIFILLTSLLLIKISSS